MAAARESFDRFSVLRRVEHWVLTLAFVALAVTGLPQRYPLAGWADWVIVRLGGLESTRIIHRWAAALLILLLFVHVIEVAYRLYVERVELSMLPGVRDVRDVIESLRYYLGLSRHRPRMPRYNYVEKAEYWALIWGTVMMTVTGFMLWNPISTLKLLPGEFLPAAKVAHSAEALLATLAILIWHVYWVHLKIFNRSMFNGKLTREQMEHEHALELESLEDSDLAALLPRSVRVRRERSFFPVAVFAAAVVLVALYYFATFEETALPTVPPAEAIEIFAPATPTVTVTAAPTRTPLPGPTGEHLAVVAAQAAPRVSHALTGRDKCLACHGQGKALPAPPDHAGYSQELCLVCHNTGGPGPAPKPLAHTTEGRAACLSCHTGAMIPAGHTEAGLTVEQCVLCHPVAGAAAATPTASARAVTATPVVTATSIAVPATAVPVATAPLTATAGAAAVPGISHPLEGRAQCLACHGQGKALPAPPDHAGYSQELCLVCHNTGGPGPAPNPLAHTTEGRAACLSCHTGAMIPASHTEAGLTVEQCVLCHPAPGAAAATPTASARAATAKPEPKATVEPPDE